MLRRSLSLHQAAEIPKPGLARFPNLLSPLELNNGIKLRNRVMMGSMHTGLEEAKQDPYPKMAAYFADRAQGGTGLIVTGGVAPNWEGKVHPYAGKMSNKSEARKYQVVTDAVHQHDTKILMQILHAGRYAYSPLAVAPSSIPSPIWKFNPMKPVGMPKFWIKKTIRDFANCAAMAKYAGFDGIELMASEGYLLNEFIVTHTNKRTDEYGGSYQNRMKFPLEVLKAIREATGPDFIIMMRISMLDLIPNGSTHAEICELAELVADGGANIINTGIGWHEARVPTIATSVPRASFTWVTKRVRDHLREKKIDIPLVTTNRINTPKIAEMVLQKEEADLISMARPLLADPAFVMKAELGMESRIAHCIGCNQACLDHAFKAEVASCLMNPVACAELTLKPEKPTIPRKQKRFIIVGGGPSGCQAAITLAQFGHKVTLYEATSRVGGQFHLAKQVPGKEEYEGAIRYWENMLGAYPDNIDIRLHAEFTARTLLGIPPTETPSAIIIASGCLPRAKNNKVMPGLSNNDIVLDYQEVLSGRQKIGKKVAIIGAGGIGFDVAVYLSHRRDTSFKHFAETWGIDTTGSVPGGLAEGGGHPVVTDRDLYMFQRKKGKMGAGLGKTTGWIHRTALKHQCVKQYTGVGYNGLDGNTLHLSIKDKKITVPDFDNVIICAGQVPNDEIYWNVTQGLQKLKLNEVCELVKIGGCKEAAELDAKRAIMDAHMTALRLA